MNNNVNKEVRIIEHSTCKIWDCRRPISKIPSGAYFALCAIHKLNKRNNGSDFRGTIESHLSAPFRYFSHRLIANVVETIGDLKNISSHPTVEEVARADRLEETKSLPKDQLHLDPQVIGRITIGLRTLDNKGTKGVEFMDFFLYMIDKNFACLINFIKFLSSYFLDILWFSNNIVWMVKVR